jgi:hypothetical protein
MSMYVVICLFEYDMHSRLLFYVLCVSEMRVDVCIYEWGSGGSGGCVCVWGGGGYGHMYLGEG